MQIHGIAHVHGAQPVSSPHSTQAVQAGEAHSGVSTVDQLDISPQADLVSRVRDVPDIRADRVADIRSAIAEGVYETDEMLNVAVERMLDEFA